MIRQEWLFFSWENIFYFNFKGVHFIMFCWLFLGKFLMSVKKEWSLLGGRTYLSLMWKRYFQNKTEIWFDIFKATPWMIVLSAEMEKTYKIAHGKLRARKISIQNMCKKCPKSCKISKNAQNCTKRSKHLIKRIAKK